jgi:stalled ribosome rescue protein Dom34
MIPKEAYLIVAGPGFEKDYFSDYLKKEGYSPVKRSTSYVEQGSLREIIEDSESILIEERLKKESETYEEIAKHIFKGDNYASYGREEVKHALEMNAVEILAIEDSLLKDLEIEEMMKKADQEGSKIFIFSSKTEWGEKVKGLGGIMAKLRYKLKD